MGMILSANHNTNLSDERPCEHRGKRYKSCYMGWTSCSQDSRLGDMIHGCWERSLEFRKTRLPNTLGYTEKISGISYQVIRKIAGDELSETFEIHRDGSSCQQDCFALKILRGQSIEVQEKLKNELAVMLKLGTHCPQIVRLHQHKLTMDQDTNVLELKLVLDLCSGGTLGQRLKGRCDFPEKTVRVIALQLIQALHFIHTRRIIHCDVKPDNVILMNSKNFNLKLGNFGMAQFTHNRLIPCPQRQLTLSDVYIAPEILQCRSSGTPADMWSLGVTLYRLLTGHLPFQKGSTLTMEVCQEILTGSFLREALSTHQFPDHLSFDASRFIERLLRINPNERMNVIEALNHRWLTSCGSTDELILTPSPNFSTVPTTPLHRYDQTPIPYSQHSRDDSLPRKGRYSTKESKTTPGYFKTGPLEVMPFGRNKSGASLCTLSTQCHEDISLSLPYP